MFHINIIVKKLLNMLLKRLRKNPDVCVLGM